MAWNEAQDQEFGATMQKLAMQFAQNKQQFQTYPYLPQEQAARTEAASQFMQEATHSFGNYQKTGDLIYAQEAILYTSAASATDPNVQLSTWQWSEFKNNDHKAPKAPSEETISQCLGNVAAKIVSVILSAKLGMITALTVQAAVMVTAVMFLNPVIGTGLIIPAAIGGGVVGIKAAIESEKVINKKIKSTTNWLKNCVEETYKVATGKTQSTSQRR